MGVRGYGKSLSLALLSVVFVLIGVGGLATGESPFVALALVFFGLAGIAAAITFIPRRHQAALLLPAKGADGAPTARIVLPLSRRNLITMMVGCLLFGLVGVAAIAAAPGEPLASAVMLSIAGVCALVFLAFAGAMLVTRGWRTPHITITPDALHIVDLLNRAVLPWDAVIDIRRSTAGGQGYIGLQVRKDVDFDTTPGGRLIRPLNRMFNADLFVQENSLRSPPKQVLKLLKHYWRDPEARAELRLGHTTDLKGIEVARVPRER